MDIFFSIIITTKNLIETNNVENFNLLLRLLKFQTYKNIECLVIDNLSSDGTVDILEKCKSNGLLDYISEPDEGKFFAFNKGIEKAKGKYLMFLSCDDFIHDVTAITDVINAMEKLNADILFSPSYCRHPKGFTFLFVPSVLNAFQVMPCPRQAMVFRKDAVLQEGMFDTTFSQMADFDLIIRMMLKKYNTVVLNKNFVTLKAGQKLIDNPQLELDEAKNIFIKNYSSLYPLNEEVLDNMLKVSDFPKLLLDKLAAKFSEKEREKFYETCENLRLLRINTLGKQE